MPEIKKILLYVSLLIILPAAILAQNKDTIAIARLENVYLVQPDTLQFQIRLYRTSDRWDRWANGTYMVNFLNETIPLNSQNMNLEYVYGTSDLNIGPISGQLPYDSYFITPRIFDNRMSITIAGPEGYGNCEYVPEQDGITIGTFRLSSKLGETLPERLKWLQPQFFYQACAYKIEEDSVLAGIPWGFPNDNFEMDTEETTVLYDVGDTSKPEMQLLYFHADYKGQRKVSLRWRTAREAYNKGFVIYRGIVPLATGDTTKVQYDQLVARFDGGTAEEDSIRGLGTRPYGRSYHYHYDLVEYRGEEYCYLLQYEDFNGQVRDIPYTDSLGYFHERAIDCVPIPNAVIVYAQAEPNPFYESTTIQYKVDDDVLLSCNVYDLLGNKVANLIDNEFTPLGDHEITFHSELVASQGLYEIIFIAHPIDDPNVEISRAIVKVQLIR